MPYFLIGFISILYILVGMFLGRAHGAATKDEVTGVPTGWPSWGRLASIIFFAGSAAVLNYLYTHSYIVGAVAAVINVFFFNTGHGRFFAMQGANLKDPNPEWVEKYVASWLYKDDITKPAYSKFCFGIKGLGIGLTIAPFGVLLAYLWPASYTWSWKNKNTSEYAEWLVGGFNSLVAVLGFVTYLIITL